MNENPYASPPQISTGTPVSSPNRLQKYSWLPLDTLSAVIVGCMLLLSVISLFIMLLNIYGAIALEGYNDFDADPTDQEMFVILMIGGLALLSLPVYIAAIVAVCMFMYRANANLRSIGAVGLETTPGWCVGWWFIPIANLFKPVMAMNEIYKCSARPRDSYWRSTGASAVLPLWWAAWIISDISARVETRMALMEETSGEFLFYMGLLSCGTSIVAAGSLILIVREITRRQNVAITQPQPLLKTPGGFGSPV